MWQHAAPITAQLTSPSHTHTHKKKPTPWKESCKCNTKRNFTEPSYLSIPHSRHNFSLWLSFKIRHKLKWCFPKTEPLSPSGPPFVSVNTHTMVQAWPRYPDEYHCPHCQALHLQRLLILQKYATASGNEPTFKTTKKGTSLPFSVFFTKTSVQA